MAIDELAALVGEWEMQVDLPGAEDVRGHIVFDVMGEALVQRTTLPIAEAPDSCCVVLSSSDGSYTQHYFDSRGVARLYAMTFDGRRWTLQRSEADFSPLEFHQRYVAELSADGTVIDGEWQTSADGQSWSRDFGITYRRR